jgi:hypothetical protein
MIPNREVHAAKSCRLFGQDHAKEKFAADDPKGGVGKQQPVLPEKNKD